MDLGTSSKVQLPGFVSTDLLGDKYTTTLRLKSTTSCIWSVISYLKNLIVDVVLSVSFVMFHWQESKIFGVWRFILNDTPVQIGCTCVFTQIGFLRCMGRWVVIIRTSRVDTALQNDALQKLSCFALPKLVLFCRELADPIVKVQCEESVVSRRQVTTELTGIYNALRIWKLFNLPSGLGNTTGKIDRLAPDFIGRAYHRYSSEHVKACKVLCLQCALTGRSLFVAMISNCFYNFKKQFNTIDWGSM